MTCRVLRMADGGKPSPGEAIVKPARKVSASYVPSTGPIGVTIASPGFAKLAGEAAARFQACTGLEAITLHINADVFTAKLNLDIMLPPRPIVFFDADLWMLRKADLGALAESGKWCAVPDPCATRLNNFVGKDVHANNWEPHDYFNSGLFCCDLRRPKIWRVFADARDHLAAVQQGKAAAPIDTTDQFYLNWAVQKQPGLLKRLPLGFNFFKFAITHGAITHWPAEIIGLHAAGVPLARKLETLTREAIVFGP